MADITFHAAKDAAEIDYVSDRLRPADFEEFVMGTGRHPHGLLTKMVLGSDYAEIALLDGEPVAIFGCDREDGYGMPWLLGTEKIAGFTVARALIEVGQRWLDLMARRHGELRHHVYADNHLHIRYLEALGCEIDEPKPHGPLGASFREFRYVLRPRRN